MELLAIDFMGYVSGGSSTQISYDAYPCPSDWSYATAITVEEGDYMNGPGDSQLWVTEEDAFMDYYCEFYECADYGDSSYYYYDYADYDYYSYDYYSYDYDYYSYDYGSYDYYSYDYDGYVSYYYGYDN